MTEQKTIPYHDKSYESLISFVAEMRSEYHADAGTFSARIKGNPAGLQEICNHRRDVAVPWV
jgi:hypothetical protein